MDEYVYTDEEWQEDKNLNAEELDKKYGEPQICLRCGCRKEHYVGGMVRCPACYADTMQQNQRRGILW